MMEGGHLGGMALNVLPVSDHEQIEADSAGVQSMEVSVIELIKIWFYISCNVYTVYFLVL